MGRFSSSRCNCLSVLLDQVNICIVCRDLSYTVPLGSTVICYLGNQILCVNNQNYTNGCANRLLEYQAVAFCEWYLHHEVMLLCLDCCIILTDI